MLAKALPMVEKNWVNLNDSTNRDGAEAKNHLLDGQLNSTKNTNNKRTIKCIIDTL